MNCPRPPLLAAALAGIALLAAGCGGAAHPTVSPKTASHAPPLSLATSVATTSRTWAVLVLGDSPDRADNFWQLLARPAAGGTWRLVTPPGVASNGGLAVAPTGPSSLLAGFLPSQDLLFTPLAATANSGATWSAGVLNAKLAGTPDALAAGQGTSKVLALLADNSLRQSTNGGRTWTTIATEHGLASTQVGRRCGLTRLTGTAFTPAGDPMLTGDCASNGQPGIFTFTAGTWQRTGPDVPTGQPVTALAITSTAGVTRVLLATGTGSATTLTVASYTSDPAHWSLSHQVTAGSAKVLSVSASGNGVMAVLLAGRRGLLLAGAAAGWRRLPELPPATQALAAGQGPQLQALTAARTTVGIWALNDSGSAWTQVQHLSVPIQVGSSS
ncbi:MAG TPA: hypothetical protein VGM14_20195 [Streptosporangiaceae bacterium]